MKQGKDFSVICAQIRAIAALLAHAHELALSTEETSGLSELLAEIADKLAAEST